MTLQTVGAAMREPFPYVIDPDHRRPSSDDLPPELRQFCEAGFQTFDAEPTGHILGVDLTIDGFDPIVWIEQLAEVGGGVWFSLALSMSPQGDIEAALPLWRQIQDPVDAESRRSAITRAMVLREAVKILRGADSIRSQAVAS